MSHLTCGDGHYLLQTAKPWISYVAKFISGTSQVSYLVVNGSIESVSRMFSYELGSDGRGNERKLPESDLKLGRRF